MEKAKEFYAEQIIKAEKENYCVILKICMI